MATRVYVDNDLDFENPDPFPWMDVAACHGMDTERWFTGDLKVRAEAKEICNTKCSKRVECLFYILTREPNGYRREGVFGGLEPKERQALAERLGLVKKEDKEDGEDDE